MPPLKRRRERQLDMAVTGIASRQRAGSFCLHFVQEPAQELRKLFCRIKSLERAAKFFVPRTLGAGRKRSACPIAPPRKVMAIIGIAPTPPMRGVKNGARNCE